MKKRIVAVSGATGMIGQVVVKKLLEKGYLVQDRRIEVGNRAEVQKLLKNADYLIHLAVETEVSKGRGVFEKTNVMGVANILDCLNKNTKAVMVSSVVVYKENTEDIRDTITGNYYIDTKVEGLRLIRRSKKKVVCVMPSIVVDKEKLTGRIAPFNFFLFDWLYNFIGGGIPGGIMQAIGDKNRVINLVEVNDVADGILAAMEKGKLGEEYILAGENIKSIEYLQKMSKILGKNYLKVRIPFWVVRIANYCFKNIQIVRPENMIFSYSKAERELGYKPKWKL